MCFAIDMCIALDMRCGARKFCPAKLQFATMLSQTDMHKLSFFRRDTYDGRAIIHPRFHKKLPRFRGEVVSVIGCCRRFGL